MRTRISWPEPEARHSSGRFGRPGYYSIAGEGEYPGDPLSDQIFADSTTTGSSPRTTSPFSSLSIRLVGGAGGRGAVGSPVNGKAGG